MSYQRLETARGAPLLLALSGKKSLRSIKNQGAPKRR